MEYVTCCRSGDDDAFSSLHTARCFCKRIEFDVATAPLRTERCGCAQCGALGFPRTTSHFAKAAVRFTPESGEWIKVYSPGADTVGSDRPRLFPCTVSCAQCGSWVGRETATTFAVPCEAFGRSASRSASFAPSCEVYCEEIAEERASVARFSDDRTTPLTPRDCLRALAPLLDGSGHKGGGGRIGLLGGSREYTGAPFYAAMASLRAGGELVYVMTAAEAAGPIKAYSPELMVTPVYSHSRIVSVEVRGEPVLASTTKYLVVYSRYIKCANPSHRCI